MIELMLMSLDILKKEDKIVTKDADECVEKLMLQKEIEKFYFISFLYCYCSTLMKEKVQNHIDYEWDGLTAYTIRVLIEYGLIPYNERVRKIYINNIIQWNENNTIDNVDEENPLMCLIYLLIYGRISVFEIKRIKKYAYNSKMLSFITDTDNFDIDTFDESWDFILKSIEYKNIYIKKKKLKVAMETRRINKKVL